MRALAEVTKHNINRCASFLLANGYPVMDTQNLYIKLKPENQHTNACFSSDSVPPPTRPSVMALIIVSSLLYEYVYNEM